MIVAQYINTLLLYHRYLIVIFSSSNLIINLVHLRLIFYYLCIMQKYLLVFVKENRLQCSSIEEECKKIYNIFEHMHVKLISTF